MGLKRQIVLAMSRLKNDYAGLGAFNQERILANFSMPDDSAQLYGGPPTGPTAGAGNPQPRTFWRIACLEDVLVFNGQAAINLASLIPAGAVPLSAHLNFDQPLVFAGGATNVGFGTAASPAQLAQSTAAAVAKNTKTDNSIVSLAEAQGAPVQLAITACAAAVATGTITSGTVRCRVIYRYAPSIPNAA